MSQNINLLITVPFPEKMINILQAISSQLQITVRQAHTPDDIPADIWERTDVLYSGGVVPGLEQAPNLKWIQFHFAGIDRVANAPILQDAGVIATNLSGAHAPQMGEHVLMMLLALSHKLPEMQRLKTKADWHRDYFEQNPPVELYGSTVGIIGYGGIGREVTRLLRGFGATVLAAKWNAMQPQERGYSLKGLGDPSGDLPRRIYPFQALKSMIKECDFLVVAVPLTPGTQGLLGTEELTVMKPSAFIVDVSRGGVIDHIALIRVLKDKKIAGAALDVFPEEPLPKNSPLWKMPNVIISPHIAGVSGNYQQRAITLFAENLRRYLGGEPLYNQFEAEKGY